jgi:N-methylhydantoinase A
MSVADVSKSVYEVTLAKTSNALREITVEKGLDPRDFSMVAYGGAGPMFVPLVAREIGIDEVIVPQAPSVFSAWGMLMAEVVYDFSRTVIERLNTTTLDDLEKKFEALEAEADETLGAEDIRPEDRIFERSAAMRYYGQEHSVQVSAENLDSLAKLRERFETEHEAQYGHTMEDTAEIVHVRVRGRGETESPETRSEKEVSESTPTDTREAYCCAREAQVDFAVYDRAEVGPAIEIDGPAIIREPTTTIVIHSDQFATVDQHGSVVISGGDQE